MGTLGTYLRTAREGLGLDLHEAAQQTRINVNYLKGMEEENFSKLPGEVFIKGFLKNYGRFLNLPEAEVLKRYAELKPQPAGAGPSAPVVETKAAPAPIERKKKEETPLEPFVWGAGIFIAVIIFLFTAVPGKQNHQIAPQPVSGTENASPVPGVPVSKPEKLYLEIVALEDVWLLIRTDSSPQKKAVLKKGETITWSADNRFLLSCGNIGGVKLLLNGNELTVNGPKNAVIRDLAITASGIAGENLHIEQPSVKAKPKPAPHPIRQEQATSLPAPVNPPARQEPVASVPPVANSPEKPAPNQSQAPSVPVEQEKTP